jgi:hypothetical protein
MYKNIGLVLLGALIGSLITYKYLTVNYEEVEDDKKSAEKLAAELAEYRKPKEHLSIGGYNIPTPGEVIELIDKASLHPGMDSEERTRTREDIEEERIEYAKEVLGYTGDEDEEIEFIPNPRQTEIQDKPFVITVDLFAEDCVNYDKLTVYYYEVDNVLVDEGDDAQMDIETSIGYEALDEFGYGNPNPDLVYVRNDHLEIDYEVIRLGDSYEESVMEYEK